MAAVSEVVTDTSSRTGDDTGRVERSVGADETPPGSVLSLGEPAVVAMEGAGKRGLVSVTVVDISRGSAGDLGGFGIDERVAGQALYYMRLSMENVGDTEMPYAPLDIGFGE